MEMKSESSGSSAGTSGTGEQAYRHAPSKKELIQRHERYGYFLRVVLLGLGGILILNLLVKIFLPFNTPDLPVEEYPYHDISISHDGKNVLMAAARNDSLIILKSKDEGKTWTEKHFYFRSATLPVICMDWTGGKGTIIGAAGDGLVTGNFGDDWEKAYHKDLALLDVRAGYINLDVPSGRVLAVDNDGLLRKIHLNSGWLETAIQDGKEKEETKPETTGPDTARAYNIALDSIAAILQKTQSTNQKELPYLNQSLQLQKVPDMLLHTGLSIDWNTGNAVAIGKHPYNSSGFIHISRDTGNTWTNVGSFSGSYLNTLYMDWTNGAGIAWGDAFWETKDFGNTWKKISGPQSSMLQDLQMNFKARKGIVLGYDFKARDMGLYQLADNGTALESKRLQGTLNFEKACIHPLTGNGFAVASSKTIRASPVSDRGVYRIARFGEEVQRIIPYRIRSNEWVRNLFGSFSAGLFLGFGLLGYLALRRSQVRKNIKHYEEIYEENVLALMTDNPSEEDRLGMFENTSSSIISLLKNPDTRPPVTVILNGSWGSGKSSLMAQIRSKLKKDSRFVTMWFNVWHFESEQHLLTVFLANILQTFEQSYGFWFRFRLFVNRLKLLPFPSKLMFWFGILVLLPLVFFLILQLEPIHGFLETYGKENLFLGDLFISLEHLLAKENLTEGLVLPASIVMWLLGLFFVKNKLFASGLSSFIELIPLDKFRMEAASGDPGFREKYKKEFWELVNAAGKDMKFVIFIDDMDRISGEKIKELLEGINFISDTASRPDNVKEDRTKVYFIIGMSVDEVIRNLGDKLSPGEEDTDRLGARFLEKMVDLVVQVPDINTCAKDKLKILFTRSK